MREPRLFSWRGFSFGGAEMQTLVIGGGLVGALIARELTRYEMKVLLVEKREDLGQGITKANSAILHGGYDDPPNTLRGKLCAKGNRLYNQLAEELKIAVNRVGSIVVAKGEEELRKLEILLENGKANSVEGLRIVGRQELRKLEPGLSKEFDYALLCESAGVIEPWMVAIAASMNAVNNGAEIITGNGVVGAIVESKRAKRVKLSSGREIEADLVINASGLFYEQVSSFFGVYAPPVKLRKGEYILLDKRASTLVNRVIFPLPTAAGKGRLVVPTIDGGVLLGPTSVEFSDFFPEDVSTTAEGLISVRESGDDLIPGIDSPQWFLKSFAGLRPESPQKDFYIKKADELENFITVGAIRSPGLTAAPAIAEYVVGEVIGSMDLKLTPKDDFNPFIDERLRIKELPFEEVARLIEADPKYGRIICQCNEVSEAEVIQAIKDGARTVDGVKFRTRAGFGRCQGGFCSWKIASILARELNKDMSGVRQNSQNSWIINGKVRT
jgi:glycerol-3-phosphate dehydrogenase